jgi:putative spermidine/putrescine transport system permease protein
MLLPGLILVSALFLIPLCFLLFQSVHTRTGYSVEEYRALFSGGNLFSQVVIRTLWISSLVAVLTFVLGYPLAYLAVRLPSKWSIAVLVCVVLPFFTAALVRTYAWQVLLANNGPINKLLQALHITREPIQLVYNDIGVVIGTTQVLLPMMIFPLYSTMRGIDRSLQLAAQSMGASPFTAFRTVFLPQTRPAISSGLSLVFISTLGYFITPVLLQGPSTPMLAQRIFSQINLPGQSGTVSAQATVVLVMAVLVMYLLRRRLGIVLEAAVDDASEGRSGRTGRARTGIGNVSSQVGDVLLRRSFQGRLGLGAEKMARGLSAVRYPLVGVLAAIALIVLLLPLIIIAIVAFSDSEFLQFPPQGYSTRWFGWYFDNTDWMDSTLLSGWLGAVAALIATGIGSFASFAIVRARSRRLPTMAYLLMAAPLVMPQILFATALFYTLAPTGLLGKPPALIMAYSILGLPLVVIIMSAMFRGLDADLERAAASLGASPRKVAMSVVVPLARPAIASALLFAFIAGFDDLVMSQFLGSFNLVTLMRRLYENILFEVSPAVASVGILLIGFVILAMVIGAIAARKRPGAGSKISSL